MDTHHALSRAAGVFLGDALATPRRIQRWQTAIQTSVLYSTAEVALLALGGHASATCRDVAAQASRLSRAFCDPVFGRD